MNTMTTSSLVFLIHGAVSLLVAFAFLIFWGASGVAGFKFSRKLKLKDREAWLALTGGGSVLFLNSIFTVLSRLKVIIPKLDDELSVEAMSFVKTAKISLCLFGVFAVLILALELY